MNEKLKQAVELFYKKDYTAAKEAFIELNETYEAGLCSLLLQDLKGARNLFEVKKGNCPASDFGLFIIDLIEDKKSIPLKYFQTRAFLEIFLNLFIENKLFDWAQKIINNYEYFTKINLEAPKFIARVLNANNYNKTVHNFSKIAKEVCYYDAEIYYIDAKLCMAEKNYDEARKNIETCLSFAPEYYPVLMLKKELDSVSA